MHRHGNDAVSPHEFTFHEPLSGFLRRKIAWRWIFAAFCATTDWMKLVWMDL